MNQSQESIVRISENEMQDTFRSILTRVGVDEQKAKTCAEIFTANSLEGVYTHGVNRFPRFVSYIQKGYVKIAHDPLRVSGVGGLEQWDGNAGAGPLNAIVATDRAIALSQQNGIGCVAMKNTNHWMRGGYYGWRAARAGYVFIGWTNTIGNMPAWGAIDGRLGNNPLVLAVPHGNDAVVLDMAMSQYSYGAMDLYRLRNEKLPFPGGYDAAGNLTQDPALIMESRRTLPIGFWKGAGLSLLLDLLATILSGGLSTSQISSLEAEQSLSQVFVAIDLSKLHSQSVVTNVVNQILDDYKASIPENNSQPLRYPGERLQAIRDQNRRDGIPVSVAVWNEIISLR